MKKKLQIDFYENHVKKSKEKINKKHEYKIFQKNKQTGVIMGSCMQC